MMDEWIDEGEEGQFGALVLLFCQCGERRLHLDSVGNTRKLSLIAIGLYMRLRA